MIDQILTILYWVAIISSTIGMIAIVIVAIICAFDRQNQDSDDDYDNLGDAQ